MTTAYTPDSSSSPSTTFSPAGGMCWQSSSYTSGRDGVSWLVRSRLLESLMPCCEIINPIGFGLTGYVLSENRNGLVVDAALFEPSRLVFITRGISQKVIVGLLAP